LVPSLFFSKHSLVSFEASSNFFANSGFFFPIFLAISAGVKGSFFLSTFFFVLSPPSFFLSPSLLLSSFLSGSLGSSFLAGSSFLSGSLGSSFLSSSPPISAKGSSFLSGSSPPFLILSFSSSVRSGFFYASSIAFLSLSL